MVRTDHGSLRWLTNFKNPEGQVARWLETLSSFTFTIEHRSGRLHGNADGLSRIPSKQCGMDDKNQDIETTKREIPVTVQTIKPQDEHLDLHNWQENDSSISTAMQWVLDTKHPTSREITSASYFVKNSMGPV